MKKLLLALACLFLSGCGKTTPSSSFTPVIDKPHVETPEQIVVERVVTQNITVEVIREVPRYLRDFTSVEELFGWLDNNLNLYGDILSYELPPKFDCDDFAQIMQKKAEHDGYRMNIEVCTIFGRLHMRLLVIIGNGVYSVEPQTHEVNFCYYLD